MELAALDRELDRLRQASSRASANLLELEADPTRALLDSIELDGLTASRWATASGALAGLFVSCQALHALLDQVATQRSSWSIVTPQRAGRLRAMLLGYSIERPERSPAIEDRSLVDASRVVERCTPDELLGEMAGDFDVVKAVVFGVACRWEELPVRLRTIRERIERLGEPALEALDRRRRELAELVLVDPLAVDDDLIAALEGELQAIEAVHDDADAAIAAIRALVETVPGAVALANEAREAAAVRFAAHHLLDVVHLDPTLSDRVDGLERSAADGQWHELPAEIGAVRVGADEILRRADLVVACHVGLMAERAELRGRLDALEAKAGALAHVEDPARTTLAERAHGELYTAPTDLRAPRVLLEQYVDALHGVAR